MQLYADLPPRRNRQVVADVLGILWILGAIWFAKQVYDLVSLLNGPGEALERSGADLADSMRGASERVDGIPLAGDALASPFNSAADAASALSAAGQTAQDAVHALALIVGVFLVSGAILLAVLFWVLPRLVWVRRAQAARLVLVDPDGADLLALRALATRPLRQLAVVGGDGVLDRWRRGDAATIESLAALELGDLGLDGRRLPPRRALGS